MHLSDGQGRDKGSSPGQLQGKEAGVHVHLEGWMKQPRWVGRGRPRQEGLDAPVSTAGLNVKPGPEIL